MRLAVVATLVLAVLVPATAFAVDAEVLVRQGNLAGDRYGHDVAGIGDINGDGFGDFAVGSPDASTPGGLVGTVAVYLGRPGSLLGTVPDLVFSGELAGDQFGYAIAPAGDIDGDTYDDFLVGAPGRDAAGSNSGRVYLFLGGETVDPVSDAHWDGTCPGGAFGTAVAGNFDLDHDTVPDFAVGAPSHDCSGLNKGQVTVFLGGSPGYASVGWTFLGDQANWGLGRSVSGVHDLNDDGIDDLAAGAPQDLDANSGRVAVWYGVTSAALTPTRVLLVGENGQDRFGWDVAGAGDLTGDGEADLLVGAPGAGTDHGAAYLFRGGPLFDTTHDWKTTGGGAGYELGYSVSGGRDFDGDGLADFVVGEPGAAGLGNDSGRARIFLGAATPTLAGDLTLLPSSPRPTFEAGDRFGTTVGLVGSVNGDAISEILVGAPDGDGVNGITGYMNFFYNPDLTTPVRLLSLEARGDGARLVVEWELADAHEVSGVRVEGRGSDGLWAPLHGGWLDPAAGLWNGDGAAETVRLTALDRAGGVVRLGEARVGRIPGEGLRVLSGNPGIGPLRLGLDHDGGRLRIAVWDVTGRLVRELDAGAPAAGPVVIDWDGTDDTGARVPPGVYLLRTLDRPSGAPLKVVRIL